MKVRALTPEGDYSFGGNRRDYIEGAEAVAQIIKTKILLFYYEWWEDLGQGIPMFQSIIGQMNAESITNSLSMLLRDRILEIEQVDSVEDITVNFSRKNRVATAQIRVNLISGEQTEVEVQI